MKKKRKHKPAQDGWLDNLLRFEIVVLLFGLIGFYYFLSFSPIRMPKKPIASPQVSLAPLPPLPESVTVASDEGLAQVVSGAGSSSLPAEVVVPPVSVVRVAVAEVNSDDTLPVVVENQKIVPDKDSISHKELASNEDSASNSAVPEVPASLAPVESAQSNTLAPVEPVSVSPRIVSASAPVSAIVPKVQMEVEVGSYVLQSDLHKYRAQLEKLGFVVKTEMTRRWTPMYRVYLGPYPDRPKAQKMIVEARKMGDQPFLQESGSGYVTVIGSFYLESSVVAWENMYQAAGFKPSVQKVDLMMPHQLLLLDSSQVNQDMQASLARIQALGFPQARLVKSE